MFADGIISHARLGGPYFVTPVKNGTSAFQGATLDTYMEHEIAHTFWALDEHLPYTGWWACSLRTGYLNQPNCNSLVPAAGYCNTPGSPCDIPPAQCLMKGNYPDSVCKFTEWQIGWADRNLTGKPDLLETRASAFPDSDEYRGTAGTPVTLTGHALEVPIPNDNPAYFGLGDAISIATIDSVRFRVDGGPPQSATPADGAFDSGRESFRASLGALPAGNYLVDWEVWNSNGLQNLTSPTTAVSLVAPSSPAGADGDGTPPTGMSLHLGPSPGDGAVRFRLRGTPHAEGRASVFDVAGRMVARWTVRMPASGALDWRWDGKDGGGAPLPSGLYFATVELAGRTVTRRLVVAR
jgi:flagellar hook capping protein FlgD